MILWKYLLGRIDPGQLRHSRGSYIHPSCEMAVREKSSAALAARGAGGCPRQGLRPGRLLQLYLRELLRLMHPRFHQHLCALGEDGLQMLFCHRWILLCFKREFPEAEALRMWEACWAHYQVRQLPGHGTAWLNPHPQH